MLRLSTNLDAFASKCLRRIATNPSIEGRVRWVRM
jgi:hypothetical protein